MGLFDKIKGSDEEVELRPPAKSEERLQPDTGTAEAAEDDDEPFLLPGMEPSGDTSTEEEASGSSGPGTSRSRRDAAGPDGEKMQRIIRQNERIIELLEDIAGGDENDTIWG